jgi:hypothetical protein
MFNSMAEYPVNLMIEVNRFLVKANMYITHFALSEVLVNMSGREDRLGYYGDWNSSAFSIGILDRPVQYSSQRVSHTPTDDTLGAVVVAYSMATGKQLPVLRRATFLTVQDIVLSDGEAYTDVKTDYAEVRSGGFIDESRMGAFASAVAGLSNIFRG